MTTNYVTLADVKAELHVTDSQDDSRLQTAIDAACRLVETHCNRVFYQDAAVSYRYYIPSDIWTVETDDFDPSTLAELAVDVAGTKTFSQVWSSADYQLEPLNNIINGQPWPCTKIRAVRSLYFPVYGGASIAQRFTQSLIRVQAKWGWSSVPSAVVQAAKIQSLAIFKGTEAPLGATGFAEAGILRVRSGLHPTAEMLLQDFRKETAYVI